MSYMIVPRRDLIVICMWCGKKAKDVYSAVPETFPGNEGLRMWEED